MKDLTLFCKDELRRRKVRAATLNGLDYLEVSDDQRTLTVFFLARRLSTSQKKTCASKAAGASPASRS